MKKIYVLSVGCLILFVLALAIAGLAASDPVLAATSDATSDQQQKSAAEAGDGTSASTASVAAAPEVLEGYKEGLWRDGKAVFSDIELFDLFWRSARWRRGYRPKQPINFSHNVHLEKNKMECQYCHFGVAKSPYATMPAVETCMGCHNVVKTESEEIKKLKDYYDKGEPVPWEPVNNLPDHVIFNHQRHVKAGVGCQNCHGQMQKQNVAEKVSSFKMGFCVSCHRDQGASIDCATCHY